MSLAVRDRVGVLDLRTVETDRLGMNFTMKDEEIRYVSAIFRGREGEKTCMAEERKRSRWFLRGTCTDSVFLFIGRVDTKNLTIYIIIKD